MRKQVETEPTLARGKIAKAAIQCDYPATGKTGSFLFTSDNPGKLENLCSPLFPDLVPLYEWCRKVGWINRGADYFLEPTKAQLIDAVCSVVGFDSMRRYEIVERRASIGDDGKTYTCGHPYGVKLVGQTPPYYVFMAHDGVTYGQRYPSRDEAAATQAARAAAAEKEMRDAIQNNTEEQLLRQVAYWLPYMVNR